MILPDLLQASKDLGLRLWLLGGRASQATKASNLFLHFHCLQNCSYFEKLQSNQFAIFHTSTILLFLLNLFGDLKTVHRVSNNCSKLIHTFCLYI